jgi:hypothetical protein
VLGLCFALRLVHVERGKERDPRGVLVGGELVAHLDITGDAGAEVLDEPAGEVGDFERFPPAASSSLAG